MRRAFSLCTLLLGVCFLLFAGYLLLHTQQQEQSAQLASQSVTESFTQALTIKSTDEPLPVPEAEEQPSLEIDGELYIGIISIPQLQLTLPVASTWSTVKLQSTPCTFSGSFDGGDLIIAAHNYKAHFGSINQLVVGDEISILDATGVQHNYVLTGQDVLDGDDLTGLNAGAWDLTLLTCLYGDNTQRVILRFQAVEQK